MRKMLRNYLLIIASILFHEITYSQVPDFSGTWKLNFQKSKLDTTDDLKGLTGQIFVIKQNDDKFKLKIYHQFGTKTRKIGFSMRLDGKTRLVKLIFKGKLEETEKGLKASMWRNNYQNIVDYSFGATPNELVADEVFKGRPKDHHSVWVFDKVLNVNSK